MPSPRDVAPVTYEYRVLHRWPEGQEQRRFATLAEAYSWYAKRRPKPHVHHVIFERRQLGPWESVAADEWEHIVADHGVA